MQITRYNFTIEGISQWADASYKICEETDQSVWFSPGGDKGCVQSEALNDIGVFNKVTLDLHYHVGGYLAVLKCAPAKRV
jgi:hypothetical protein